MKERPIVFSGPMVNAILAGRKTQTRRVMRSQPPRDAVQITRADWPRYSSVLINSCSERLFPFVARSLKGNYALAYECPYGVIGDRLWAREAFAIDGNDEIVYRAAPNYSPADICPVDRWKPSIHMPRWASRITLEIISVGVERLQDISEEDARAEGVSLDFDYPVEGLACPRCRGQGLHQCFGENYGISETECKLCDTAKKRFAILWDRINAKRAPWESNPWVWVLEFKRVEA